MEYNLNELVTNAQKVAKNAYAPYSKFKVGCIVVSQEGKSYAGCNVENISFGLTICAERNAVFKGVAEEGTSFKIAKVVIFTSTKSAISPCGACRQVLGEFGNDFEVVSVCESADVLRMKINELLPESPDIHLQG